MSMVGASVLVDIEPDFRGFEEALTRGLRNAVAKAQQEASVAVSVNISKQQENAIGGMNDGLAETNRLLSKVVENTNQTAKALKTSFVGSILKAVTGASLLAASLSTIAKGSKDTVETINTLGTAFNKFKAGSAAAETLSAKVRLMGRSVRDSYRETAQFSEATAGVTERLDRYEGRVDRVKSAQDKLAEAVKRARSTTDKASEGLGNFEKAAASAETTTKKATLGMEGGFKKLFASIKKRAGEGGESGAINFSEIFKGSKKAGEAAAKDAVEGITRAVVKSGKVTTKAMTGVGAESLGGFNEGIRKAVPQSEKALDPLGIQLRKLNKNVTGSARGLQVLAPAVGQTGSALAKMAFRVRDVSGAFTGFFLNPIRNAPGNLVNFVRGTKAASESTKGFGDVLTLGKNAALGLSVAVGVALLSQLGKLVSMGFQAAASMEQSRIALEGVFRTSAEGTQENLDLINRFAAVTPFSLQTAVNAVIKLKSAFTDLDVEGALNITADISAAAAAAGRTEDSVLRATLAIQQIGSKGRLAAEEINQFTEALPNVSRTKVFEIIAKKLNKTTAEVQRLQETSTGIESSVGINALLEAARGAPGAEGALERQSKTFIGLMSTFKDEMNKLLADLFQPLLVSVGGVLKTVTQEFTHFAPQIKAFASTLAAAFSAIVPVFLDNARVAGSFLSALIPIISIGVQLLALFVAPFNKLLAQSAKLMARFFVPALVGIVKVLAFVGSAVNTFLANLERLYDTFTLLVVQALKPQLEKLKVALGELVASVKKAFSDLTASVKSSGMEESLKKIGTALLQLLPPLVAIAGAVLVNFIAGIDAITRGFNNFGEALRVFFPFLLTLGRVLFPKITALILAFVAGLSLIPEAINAAARGLIIIADLLGKKIPKSAQDLTTSNTSIVDSFKDIYKGLKDGVGGLLDFGGGAVTVKKVLVDLEREMSSLINTADGFPRVLESLAENFTSALRGGNIDDIKRQVGFILQAQQEIFKPLDPFVQQAEALRSLTEAQKAIKDIDAQRTDLLKQRKALIENETDKAEEEYETRRAIKDIELQLLDLARDRAEIIRVEQRRQEDYQPTLLDFEDKNLSANIALARAKREVEDAQIAINKAIEDGLDKESISVDLAGLSLDQIRIRLAQVRATLAAQKQGKPKDEVDKERQKVELQENFLLAGVGVRDAEQAIVDLQEEKVDFIRESVEAQEEYGRKLEEINDREIRLNFDRIQAEAKYQALQRGEIGIKAEIKRLDMELLELAKNRAEAARNVALAEAEVAVQSAIVSGNAVKLGDALQRAYDLRLAGVTRDRESQAALEAQKAAVEGRNVALDKFAAGLNINIAGGGGGAGSPLTSVTPYIIGGQINFDGIGGLPQVAARDALGKEILGPFREVLQKLVDQFILSVPSLLALKQEIERLRQVGGIPDRFYADGGIVTTATKAIIGEAGREAVLPLTRYGRMSTLLASPSVWAPIMSAMPARAINTVVQSPGVVVNPSIRRAGSSPAGVGLSLQDKKKDMQMLAGMIATAIREEGVLEPRTVEVQAPITMQATGNPQIDERALVRRILAALEGKL